MRQQSSTNSAVQNGKFSNQPPQAYSNNKKHQQQQQQQQQQPHSNSMDIYQQTSDVYPIDSAEGLVFSFLNEFIEKNADLLRDILTRGVKKPIVSEIEARAVLVSLSPVEVDYALVDALFDTGNSQGEGQANNSETATEAAAELRSKFQKLIYIVELTCCPSNALIDTNTPVNTNFAEVYKAEANETTEITLKDLKPNTKYLLR